MRCDKHDRFYDSDFFENCAECDYDDHNPQDDIQDNIKEGIIKSKE